MPESTEHTLKTELSLVEISVKAAYKKGMRDGIDLQKNLLQVCYNYINLCDESDWKISLINELKKAGCV